MQPRSYGLWALAALAYLAAQGTGSPFLAQVAYLLAFLPLLALLWTALNLWGLTGERELRTPRTQAGGAVEEWVVLRSRAPWARLWLEVRDASTLTGHGGAWALYLPGRGRRHWLLRTPCPLRGLYRLGPLQVRSGDPFGLVRLSRRLPLENRVLVLPRTVPLPGLRLPEAELPGGGSARRRALQVTPNAAGVREYLPGDSLNRIHWPSTARTGRWMVKEFDLDPTSHVWLIPDLDRRWHRGGDADGRSPRDPDSTEEVMIEATASLARHLLGEGRAVGLIAWGERREVWPPQRGERQLLRLLELLALVRARGIDPLQRVLAVEAVRFSLRTTVILLTPSPDPAWVRMVRELRMRGVRFLAVLIDGASFDGGESPKRAREILEASGVPVRWVRRGVPLSAALMGGEVREVSA